MSGAKEPKGWALWAQRSKKLIFSKYDYVEGCGVVAKDYVAAGSKDVAW